MVHTVPWPHHLFLLCSYAFWIFISHQDFSWILEIHLLARHLHLGVLWQRLASFTPSQIISFSSFSLLYLQTTFPSLFFFFFFAIRCSKWWCLVNRVLTKAICTGSGLVHKKLHLPSTLYLSACCVLRIQQKSVWPQGVAGP